ncbi:UNVERIFIED_CONTAM: hypothetical protein HDU68_006852 [Siphonaria sp. JEL0065]|nr:hypothetical protein HDU68_006852 [Siphonaria sp. JEL0065]
MVLIGVLIGSVRPGRNGFRLATFIKDELVKKQDVQVVLIDPLELNLPIVTGQYAGIKDSPDCPPALHDLQKVFESIDGLLVVTPEYSHSYSPAVGNTLNYFRETEFYLKPAAVSTYTVGSFGGVRAEAAILPLFQSLGLVSIPKVFPVPYVQKALAEDGSVPQDTTFPAIRDLFNAFADELIWTARALKNAKATSPIEHGFRTLSSPAVVAGRGSAGSHTPLSPPSSPPPTAANILRNRPSKTLYKIITTRTSTVNVGGVITKTEVRTQTVIDKRDDVEPYGKAHHTGNPTILVNHTEDTRGTWAKHIGTPEGTHGGHGKHGKLTPTPAAIATAERPEDIQFAAPAIARDTVKPVKWAAFGFQPPSVGHKREAPGGANTPDVAYVDIGSRGNNSKKGKKLAGAGPGGANKPPVPKSKNTTKKPKREAPGSATSPDVVYAEIGAREAPGGANTPDVTYVDLGARGNNGKKAKKLVGAGPGSANKPPKASKKIHGASR